MSLHVEPFLMFEGNAEEAITFYVATFPEARVHSIVRYGAEGPGPEGTVNQAVFSIGNQTIRCIDSFVNHAFTFTPAFSLFVTCRSEDEIEALYTALLEGGEALMPLDHYGFSRKFGWVNDRFGVSWQVNLP